MITLERKALRFKVQKAAGRTFTGLASTWDVDAGGDLIVKGAYARTLKEWKRAEANVPLIDQHNYTSVLHVVGKMLDAVETDVGLEADFTILDGPEGEPYAARVGQGLIDGLSIGYEVRGWREPTDGERKRGVWRVLTDIELREVSLVIWGMNPYALIDTSSVKSLAGSLASLKRETLTDDDRKTLRQIAGITGALLRPLDDRPPGEQPADADVETKQEPSPDAPPGDPADAPKAATMSAEETAALRQELLAFQIRQTLHA